MITYTSPNRGLFAPQHYSFVFCLYLARMYLYIASRFPLQQPGRFHVAFSRALTFGVFLCPYIVIHSYLTIPLFPTFICFLTNALLCIFV